MNSMTSRFLTLALIVSLAVTVPTYLTSRAYDFNTEPTRLLSSSASSATSGAQYYNGTRQVAIEVTWGTGLSAGTVIFEASNDDAYTGTWAEIASFAWTAAGKKDRDSFPGPFQWVRVRTTGIVGGTVIVETQPHRG